VIIASTGKSAIASVQIFIPPSPVVALIQGGSHRSMQVDNSLLLDGSKSYDKDRFAVTGRDALLTFTWSCKQVLPVLRDTCALNIDPAQLHDPALLIRAGSQASLTTSIITLQVRGDQGKRFALTTVKLHVLNETAPIVTLISKLGRSKLSVGSKLILEGTVALQGVGNAVWSVNDPSIDLAQISLVPIVVDLSRAASISLDLFATFFANSRFRFNIYATVHTT
jgi:hypothetical protein